MTLIGVNILNDYKYNHSDIVSQVDSWMLEVKEAKWSKPLDVKRRYSSADFFKNNNVVINIKGNSYRLLFQVNYFLGVVLIRKIGTHTEYDKWKLE